MSQPRRALFVLLAALLALLAPTVVAGEEEPPKAFYPHIPSDWLVIAPVDFRGRRPFNPDAVFERYLLDPKSGVPHEGDSLTGERGKPESWTAAKTGEKGRLTGRIGWAYTEIEAPEDAVVMANARGGAALFVNGTPHVGDIYGGNFTVPVKLRKGTNRVFVRGVRGGLTLTFRKPPEPIFMAPFRMTRPDLVAGEPVDTVAGVLVVNAREEHLGQVTVILEGNEWLERTVSPTNVPIPPLSMVQARVHLKTKQGKTAPTEPAGVEVPITIGGAYTIDGQETILPLQVRPRAKAFIRTFVSEIDDSVQMFGLREPDRSVKTKRPVGLVLSLHGAGVNPRAQTRSYSQKPDFWIAAATNRRPFGFDWQDWGRLDAYEVLEEALRISGVDRRRVYLTGHSMGGHGVWHLAANDPDGFAAIAPSAAWISFDTYPGPRPPGALRKLWHAADGPSKTKALLRNVMQLPTYIVHGTNDTNVPVAQARTMERLLTDAGAKPLTHYAEGKGHWWNGPAAKGADCVDWPGIFKLFRKHEIAESPRKIQFETKDLSTDASHHWVTILEQARYGRTSRLKAEFDPDLGVMEIRTQNVRALRIDHTEPVKDLYIDGDLVSDVQPEDMIVMRVRANATWQAYAQKDNSPRKRPGLDGPLKRAFSNRFLFVYGTRGSDAETATLLAQARYDAQRWMYRGNGQSLLLSDREWLSLVSHLDLGGRNLILYGNADTNGLFAMLPRRCPIVLRRNTLLRGGRARVSGGLAAAFVQPISSDAGRLIAVMGSTGEAGARLGCTTMLFVSGAGWPDYTVFDDRVLTRGDGGVIAAGWFDFRWALQAGGFVHSEEKPVNPK